MNYFLAVEISNDFVKSLKSIDGLPVSVSLHLTLNFLGKLPEEKMMALICSLQKFDFQSFEVVVDGTGMFDNGVERCFLWCGVSYTKEFMSFRENLERVIKSSGLSKEDRAYKPHITLARLGEPNKLSQQFLDDNSKFSFQIKVEEFCLYSSDFENDKPTYKIIERFEASEEA